MQAARCAHQRGSGKSHSRSSLEKQRGNARGDEDVLCRRCWGEGDAPLCWAVRSPPVLLRGELLLLAQGFAGLSSGMLEKPELPWSRVDSEQFIAMQGLEEICRQKEKLQKGG